MDEFCVCLPPIGLTTGDRRDKGTVSQDCYKAEKYTWMKVAALKIAADLYTTGTKDPNSESQPQILLIKPGFRIRIRIQSDHWIRIRIRNLNTDPDPGGQK